MRRPNLPGPREQDFTAPAHDVRVSARLGLWLGIAFGLCLITGVLSHFIQHPGGWFRWPTRPVNLYRITQGTHVISGIAAIPLLLFKLWSVYPKLFARPAVRSIPHAIERLSLLVLIAASFFELATGVFNVAQSYPWRFFFPAAHYAAGFLAVGAMLVHVAVKLPRIRSGLAARVTEDPGPGVPGPEIGSARPVTAGSDPPAAAGARGGVFTRRGFLGAATVATSAAVVATAGVTIPVLRRVSVLGWSSGDGPQHLPVNRTAAAAGVATAAADPGFLLQVGWPGGESRLRLTELAALPQTTADLPIACVEGWSATATWTGVRLRDLLRHVGAPTDAPVRVESLERVGGYRASTLPAAHVADPLTLLALRLNGRVLTPDHGYPCRIVAPSRPGVLQTKWVVRLQVQP
jgi:hypothetical protein